MLWVCVNTFQQARVYTFTFNEQTETKVHHESWSVEQQFWYSGVATKRAKVLVIRKLIDSSQGAVGWRIVIRIDFSFVT